MSQKKYELLLDKSIELFGVKIYRIRALVSFSSVAAGELGGYLEAEANLSQTGDAWVSGNAQVSGNAWVSGNAQVSGNAWVSGNAQVSGNAWVSGNAQVFGNARVSGNAQVSGNTLVSGNAQVSGTARVFGDARVSGNARVPGSARVFGNAWVSGDAWVSPLNLSGAKYNITVLDTHIQIGCKFFSYQQWADFTEDEISRFGEGALEWREWKGLILSLSLGQQQRVAKLKGEK